MLADLKHRLARLLPTGFRAFVAARTDSHRRFVGPDDEYDLAAASQFNLLTLLGLREHHTLLDVGCGSLRAGRLFIIYLQPGRYFGIEPEPWLVETALHTELGADVARLKRPTFDHNRDFALGVFARTFDFILASSIFSHATPAQVGTCLAAARLVMTPTSYLLASFTPGASDYDGDTWVYPGMVTYRPERIVELAHAAGLDCEPLDWPYVYGTARQTWLAFALAEPPG
jgi:cyclopropane fatty-acyl-phospholipid synthase-like methyltransferase